MVRLQGAEIDSRPLTPSIPDTGVNFIRSSSYIDQQRQIRTSFLYRITPVHPGQYSIPPIALRSGGQTYQTPELNYTVHPVSKLTALPTGVKNHQILSAWFPAKTNLYQGEKCPVTLKLYIPLQLTIARNGWGLPDPAKKNCLAWRFSLPQTAESSHVTIDGTSYKSATFNTTLSGLSPGQATFGPAPVRIVIQQSIIDPLRGSRLVNTPIELEIPSTSFHILELPDNAPKGFDGAVGQFTLDAFNQQNTLLEEEPTEVILQIRGRGNLESLKVPPLSGNAWKIIDSAKVTRGEERRKIQGVVTFRQLLRPLRSATNTLPKSIPPYKLSYFDPDQKIYQTLETAAIPITITPSTKAGDVATSSHVPPEKLGTAPHEMRDILGFINQPKKQRAAPFPYARYWHFIPALLVIILLSIPLRKKWKAARVKHPDNLKKEQALSELQQTNDESDFYRLAGNFIERWLNRNSRIEAMETYASELDHILSTRDRICFQPENDSPNPIHAEDKQSVLNILKQCSKLPIMVCLVWFQFSTSAEASLEDARNAWKAGNYQQAIDLYQGEYPDPANTPADVLFNIGNCYHRLDQPGPAALAWRRVLASRPQHQRARQNLRFVELEQRAIVPEYTEWQQLLTWTTPSSYRLIFHSSLWLFTLTALSFVIFRPRRLKAALGITLLVICPTSAILGFLAQSYYPDDHAFSPIQQQAVLIEPSQLYREAQRHEEKSRSLPATSLVKIEAVRGPWTYILVADGSKGWIPSQKIHQVAP